MRVVGGERSVMEKRMPLLLRSFSIQNIARDERRFFFGQSRYICDDSWDTGNSECAVRVESA